MPCNPKSLAFEETNKTYISAKPAGRLLHRDKYLMKYKHKAPSHNDTATTARQRTAD